MRHDLALRNKKKTEFHPELWKLRYFPIRCVTSEFKCMIFTAFYLALDASWNYEHNRQKNRIDRQKITCKASVNFFSDILILVCLEKCPFGFYCSSSNAWKIEKMSHFWLSLHKQRRYAQIMWILLWLHLK